MDFNKGFSSESGFGNKVESKCYKCNGTKRFRGVDGTIQTCWDCLAKGEMDQHSKDLKDSRIKL